MQLNLSLLAILAVACSVSYTVAQLLSEYHQNDYDVKFEILKVVWYNQSLARNLQAGFIPYNRTQRVANGSVSLLINLSRDVKVDVQFYKLMSNEYRFFPITVSGNVCDEYDRNSFNAQNILKNISNVRACPWKKGFYYIRNGLPDISRFPPYIPRGAYKVEGKVYHKSDFFIHGEAYGSVLDKPVNWKI